MSISWSPLEPTSLVLYKSDHTSLTDTEFINFALDKMYNDSTIKAMVVGYTNSDRTSIDYIAAKTVASPYDKPTTTNGQVVFFDNQDLSVAQYNWSANSPGVTMDYGIWNDGYEPVYKQLPSPRGNNNYPISNKPGPIQRCNSRFVNCNTSKGPYPSGSTNNMSSTISQRVSNLIRVQSTIRNTRWTNRYVPVNVYGQRSGAPNGYGQSPKNTF